MGVDLPLLWTLLIGFGLMMYVAMDGFDLGTGILFLFVRDRDDRDTMVSSVSPVWDGNETWLVFVGASLLAAFPLAYSIILSALYIPLILMLIGLILRGVAFEFRFKADDAHRRFWDVSFAGGSCLAALMQGVALGTFVNGFDVSDGAYAGGALDWLTPFSLFTGVGVMCGYALLGCTWLIMKTEGDLHERMVALARPLTLAVLAAIAIVSVWTPLTHADIEGRWFTLPNLYFFAPVPVLVALAVVAMLKALAGGLKRHLHAVPFVLALVLLFLGCSGLIISLWPNIVPPSISIWEGAGPPQSLGFTLVGALFIVPVILMYTAWAYYVFRGKVRPGEGHY